MVKYLLTVAAWMIVLLMAWAALDLAHATWYRNAELTPQAQKRFPFKKCCEQSEVVNTKFSVNKTDHGDEWSYEDRPGHFKLIPRDIIHWNESAPGGFQIFCRARH